MFEEGSYVYTYIDRPPCVSYFFVFISAFAKDTSFMHRCRISLLQMAYKSIFVLFVLLLVTSTVLCQTFQYSRGWTNGKRSEFPNTAEISNLGNERFTSGELRTLKMLLHGNADEQVNFSKRYTQYIALHPLKCDKLYINCKREHEIKCRNEDKGFRKCCSPF